MHIRSRAIRTLTVAALVAGGLTAATGMSATTASAAATSCYGSAKEFWAISDGVYYPRAPFNNVYTATTNCNDINVKPTFGSEVRTCFAPSGGGVSCNAFRSLKADTWGLAATDVKVGTKFYLEFRPYANEHGLVAY
ncbi:hypothetical protein ACH4ND_30070 [Streptomyces sp. NPDC017179]|uniref:hypothetical protein n=1 Tax=Streptomyces sp. NPDC017179 TaxID=3364979 RepID=UPI003789C7D7